MKVFLDANILVSVLNKEYPLFTHTSRMLSLTDIMQLTLYTSPLCLGIAYYFAEKKSGRVLANKKISILCEKIKVTSIDNQVVKMAIKNKAVEDFEDGLEYYSAHQSGCECIITENVSDFYFSQLEVLNTSTFLEKYVI